MLGLVVTPAIEEKYAPDRSTSAYVSGIQISSIVFLFVSFRYGQDKGACGCAMCEQICQNWTNGSALGRKCDLLHKLVMVNV